MELLGKSSGKPDREPFGRLMMQAMQDAGESRKLVFEAEHFRILTLDDEDAVVGEFNLETVYQEYCAKPNAERAKYFTALVRSGLASHKEMPEEFEDAKPDILPVVRSRSTYELLWLQQRAEDKTVGPDIPYQAIGDHLLASVVYDLPEAMQSIGRETMDEWGIDFYRVMEIARHNLEETEFAVAQLGDGVYASLTGDNYDASRLLLLDLIRKFEVKGKHVAMVPHRDMLLVTGSEDMEGLGILAKLAEDAFEHPRFISCTTLYLDDDEWIPWSLPAAHPHFAQFRMLEVRSLYNDYQTQKELLDALHKKELTDLFVATYNAAEDDDGTVSSIAVWAEDVDTLLPKTHEIAFFREGPGMISRVHWNKVVGEIGHLMQPMDMYPLRYKVTAFPNDQQLTALMD